MKNKKILAIITLLGLFILLVLFVMQKVYEQSKVDTLPGTVVGANPSHIPEDQLPECSFTGAGFVEEPCYRPQDSGYK